MSLDLDARTATDDQGEAFRYERLLVATGGRPRGAGRRRRRWREGRSSTYRTLADYRRLRAAASGGARVVMGGGFIGSEIAAALAANGAR